jgi:hypothetical protein
MTNDRAHRRHFWAVLLVLSGATGASFAQSGLPRPSQPSSSSPSATAPSKAALPEAAYRGTGGFQARINSAALALRDSDPKLKQYSPKHVQAVAPSSPSADGSFESRAAGGGIPRDRWISSEDQQRGARTSRQRSKAETIFPKTRAGGGRIRRRQHAVRVAARNRPRRDHPDRASCHVQKHQDPNAPDGCADQIRRVDLSDRVGAARQRKPHDNRWASTQRSERPRINFKR